MAKKRESDPIPNTKQVYQEPPRFTQLQRYFLKYTNSQTATISIDSLRVAEKQLQKAEKTLEKSIRRGYIHMKQQPDDLKQILYKQVINEQEIKAEELKKKRDQMIQALKKLDMRQNIQLSSPTLGDRKYNHIQNLKYIPGGVLSKEQHEQLIQKIKRAQQQINRNHDASVRKLQERIAEEEEKIKKAEEQKFFSDKEMRKMKSEHNMSIRRETFEKKMAEQALANQQIEMLKHSPPLFQQKEEKFYNEVIAPSLLEKKKKLRQIREFSRNFSVKDINDHQKKYIQDRNQSLKQSSVKNKVNGQWAYKPPARTEHLTHLLQEQITQNKKKYQQKKKNIEQKILRQQNYVRLLHEKHFPQKIDPQLKQQLEQRIRKLHTQRRLTPEKTTRQIGIQNLKVAKHKKQKSQIAEASSVRHLQESSAEEKKRMYNELNYLKTKEDPEYYMQMKKRKLDKILKTKEESPEKKKKLEVESKKIEEALSMKKQLLKVNDNPNTRKQAAELMLSSIKTKMGLMQLS